MIESVTWRGPADVEGAVDTVDEATRSWLDARGISDLSDLTPDDLAAFISYLNRLPPGVRNSADFKQLLSALTSLQTGLAQTAGLSEEDKLRFQMEFLSLLADSTKGTGDGLDVAQENAASAYHSLDVINRWLEDPSSLDGDDIAFLIQHLQNLQALGYSHSELDALGLGQLATQLASIEEWFSDGQGLESGDPVERANAVLAMIEALRASGLSEAHLESLGLVGDGGLEQEVKDALAMYESKLEETDNPELAASYLREDLARITESRANSLEADQRLSQTQRDSYALCSDNAGNVANSEEQAQKYMEAPVEELDLPEPGEMTREGLEAYYQELLAYAQTIPPGSQGEPFRKMIGLKLEEISESLSEMEGDQLTPAQAYGLKMGLLAADAWLMDAAQDYFTERGDQKRADLFAAKQEEINQFASQVQNFYNNVLEQERRVLDKLF